jgi:hypothetical protein
MRTKLLSWLVLCGVAVIFSVSASAQQGRVAGHIIAAKVRGTVTAVNQADHSVRQLQDNDALAEGYVVTTAAQSSVILIFANGAAVNLGEDTTLSIDAFLMDPFDAKYSVAEAKEEPSTSVTKLTLAHGELVGNVKHLHSSAGSSFTVNTPVGAAGIRGTTFRIVFRPGGTGKVFFTLSTSEGEVLLSGTTAQEVPVGAGKEVVVTVDVHVAADGTVTLTSAPVIQQAQDISAGAQASIAAAVQEIVANNTAVFESAVSGGMGTVKSDQVKGPVPINPVSDTTPGDGK